METGWAKYIWENIPTPTLVETFTQDQYNLFKPSLLVNLDTAIKFTKIGKKAVAHKNFNRVNNFLYLHIYMILIRDYLLEEININSNVPTYNEIAELFKFDCIQKKMACSSQEFRSYVLPFIEEFIQIETGGIDYMTLNSEYINPFYILP